MQETLIHGLLIEIYLCLHRTSYDLSGKPKSIPNGGYTNRCTLPVFSSPSPYSFRSFTSSSSSLTSLRFDSIRAGVTDFANTTVSRGTMDDS